MSMKPLEGKVALVTGAAGGLGRAIVTGLAAAGARVMAADVDEKGLAAVAAAAPAGSVDTMPLDVSDFAACAAAVATCVRKLGRLDLLVNNAALGIGAIREDHFTDLVGIDEVTPAMWNRFVAVNMSGPWYLTKAAVPVMRRQGGGSIVNVTTSFFTMLRGKWHPYGPTKAGLEAMSAGQADEFAPDNIAVNIVVPGGPADTPMVPKSSGIQRGDLVQPEAMVPPIVWLASDAGKGVTGKRYIAANWKADKSIAENRASAEAPAAWPGLATAPVWPGGKPKG